MRLTVVGNTTVSSAFCTGSRTDLSISVYTTLDGLPRNGINRIVRDPHGYLWFCTWDGLSRYDGQTPPTMTVDKGCLPVPSPIC